MNIAAPTGVPTPDLTRLLRPRSVAVVGASENQVRSRSAVGALRDTDVELYLVNPNRTTAFGQPTYPSLTAIGTPVDAVLAFVNADRSIQLVREAAGTAAGGVVVNADGFRSIGPDGHPLSARLLHAAGSGLPLLGPNCNGYIDARRGLRMSGAPLLPILPGPVGLVTHSGGLIASVGAAGHERRVGFSHLISTGDELCVGIADCIDFLVSDPDTAIIALVVETIRQPAEFYAAIARAHAAGKPVIALKLGRSDRGQAIARSHTGAITSPGWVYDAAFEQLGILTARDLVDLADQLVCFTHLPPRSWSAARGVAVLTTSGGWATMAGDACAAEGVDLPALEELAPALEGRVHTDVLNPLDMSGGVVGDPQAAHDIVAAYAGCAQVDTVLALWFLDDAGLDMGAGLVGAAKQAAAGGKPVIIASIEDSQLGSAARELPARGVAPARGLRAAVRSIAAMGQYVRGREQHAVGAVHYGYDPTRTMPSPQPHEVIDSAAGPMLRFDAAMRLLRRFGLPTADYVVVDPGAVPLRPPDAERYVVKLADVPHRSELGAVRLGVARAELDTVIVAMQDMARALDLPATVVLQPEIEVDGEAFVGIDSGSELGPMVVCAPGGILVELAPDVHGALAPLGGADATALLGPLDRLGVFDGLRGRPRWNRDALTAVVDGVGQLAAAAPWIASLDINPLVASGDGFQAVDCLCLLRDLPASE